MIVVDLGCATHGEDESITKLIARFDPDLLLGFDPWPDLEEGSEMDAGTMVVLRRMAAWTYNGFVGLQLSGLRSRVGEAEGPRAVPCFDLAGLLAALPETDGLVVKFDVEGAELDLLEHLHERGTDERITLALVEFHADKPYAPDDAAARQKRLLKVLRCPVEPWE